MWGFVPVAEGRVEGMGLGEGSVPGMGVFEGTIEVPFLCPGEGYGGKMPWVQDS